MKLKNYQKNVLSTFVIVIGGFLLLNLAFILAAFVINFTISFMGVDRNQAPPMIGRVVYLVLIALISWFIFRSKLNDTIKATYLTVPLMIVFVMLGLTLYQQPKWIITAIGVLIISGTLAFIKIKKFSWLYYFSILYVALLGLSILIFNI